MAPLDWIDPLREERIKDYAPKLGQKLNTKEKFGGLGLSFGGLVAVEISKKLNLDLTILVSSAETNDELRSMYRVIRRPKILTMIPPLFFNPHRVLASWIFGTKEKNY